MIRHTYTPCVLYAIMSQIAPFAISGAYAIIAFWIITVMLFVSAFYHADLILIMKKSTYIVINIILSVLSFISYIYLKNPFISIFLISCISLTLLGIWPYFRGFLRILFWPASLLDKSREPSLGDYIAVISCGIRKFHNDLNDAAAHSLRKNNNIVLRIFESSLTLLMLILRSGNEISRAFRIRFFSLRKEAVVAPDATGCYFAWTCCVCLLIILIPIW